MREYLPNTIIPEWKFPIGVGALILVVMVMGCKEEAPDLPVTTPAATAQSPEKEDTLMCTPGSTRPCACENKGQGIQSCIQKGLAYGKCLCLGLPPTPKKEVAPAKPTPKPTKEIVTTLDAPSEVQELPPPVVDPAENEAERVHEELPKIAETLDKSIARGKALVEFLRTKGGDDCDQCQKFAVKLNNCIDTTLGTCWAFLDRKDVGFDGYTKERKTRLDRLDGSYAALIPAMIPEDGKAFLKEWRGFLKEAHQTLDAVRKVRIKRYGELPEPDLPVCQ